MHTTELAAWGVGPDVCESRFVGVSSYKGTTARITASDDNLKTHDEIKAIGLNQQHYYPEMTSYSNIISVDSVSVCR